MRATGMSDQESNLVDKLLRYLDKTRRDPPRYVLIDRTVVIGDKPVGIPDKLVRLMKARIKNTWPAVVPPEIIKTGKRAADYIEFPADLVGTHIFMRDQACASEEEIKVELLYLTNLFHFLASKQ
jgi:hypothetical protein